MTDRDKKYKLCSELARYTSYKALQKILRITRGEAKEQRKLISTSFFVLNDRISILLFTFPKMQFKVFSNINLKPKVVSFKL